MTGRESLFPTVPRERAEYLLHHWTEPAFARTWQQDAAIGCARDVLTLLDEVERLRHALCSYADAKHWAIRRNGTMYPDCIWIGPGAEDRVAPDGPDCIWIGPGAEDRVAPDGPQIARAALTGDQA